MIFKAENITPSKGSLETWPLNSQDRPGIVGTQAGCRVTSSWVSYPTPCSGSRRLLNCKEKASHIKANETRGPPVAPGVVSGHAVRGTGECWATEQGLLHPFS